MQFSLTPTALTGTTPTLSWANLTTFRVAEFNNPSSTANGTYCYRTDNPRLGTLVPCAVDATTGAYKSDNDDSGLALVDGTYNLSVVSPALPLLASATAGSYYSVDVAKEFYVMPLFKVITAGYTIYSFPSNSIMKDRRSKLVLKVYQGASSSFTISNVKLTGHGKTGKYYPYTDLAQPDGDGTTGGVPITLAAYTTYGKGNLIYETTDGNEIPVFASNYNDPNIKVPNIEFTLSMQDAKGKTVSLPVKIPLQYNLQPMNTYTININVKSAILEVTFDVLDWVTGQKEYNVTTNIGEDPLVISFSSLVDDWNKGQDDTTDTDKWTDK
jgi:hypothetical protein